MHSPVSRTRSRLAKDTAQNVTLKEIKVNAISKNLRSITCHPIDSDDDDKDTKYYQRPVYDIDKQDLPTFMIGHHRPRIRRLGENGKMVDVLPNHEGEARPGGGNQNSGRRGRSSVQISSKRANSFKSSGSNTLNDRETEESYMLTAEGKKHSNLSTTATSVPVGQILQSPTKTSNQGDDSNSDRAKILLLFQQREKRLFGGTPATTTGAYVSQGNVASDEQRTSNHKSPLLSPRGTQATSARTANRRPIVVDDEPDHPLTDSPNKIKAKTTKGHGTNNAKSGPSVALCGKSKDRNDADDDSDSFDGPLMTPKRSCVNIQGRGDQGNRKATRALVDQCTSLIHSSGGPRTMVGCRSSSGKIKISMSARRLHDSVGNDIPGEIKRKEARGTPFSPDSKINSPYSPHNRRRRLLLIDFDDSPSSRALETLSKAYGMDTNSPVSVRKPQAASSLCIPFDKDSFPHLERLDDIIPTVAGRSCSDTTKDKGHGEEEDPACLQGESVKNTRKKQQQQEHHHHHQQQPRDIERGQLGSLVNTTRPPPLPRDLKNREQVSASRRPVEPRLPLDMTHRLSHRYLPTGNANEASDSSHPETSGCRPFPDVLFGGRAVTKLPAGICRYTCTKCRNRMTYQAGTVAIRCPVCRKIGLPE